MSDLVLDGLMGSVMVGDDDERVVHSMETVSMSVNGFVL